MTYKIIFKKTTVQFQGFFFVDIRNFSNNNENVV